MPMLLVILILIMKIDMLANRGIGHVRGEKSTAIHIHSWSVHYDGGIIHTLGRFGKPPLHITVQTPDLHIAQAPPLSLEVKNLLKVGVFIR